MITFSIFSCTFSYFSTQLVHKLHNSVFIHSTTYNTKEKINTITTTINSTPLSLTSLFSLYFPLSLSSTFPLSPSSFLCTLHLFSSLFFSPLFTHSSICFLLSLWFPFDLHQRRGVGRGHGRVQLLRVRRWLLHHHFLLVHSLLLFLSLHQPHLQHQHLHINININIPSGNHGGELIQCLGDREEEVFGGEVLPYQWG